MPRASFLLAILVYVFGMSAAAADDRAAQEAYLDLVFGHCFSVVVSKSLRAESAIDVNGWSRVESFATSPSVIATSADVDLRSTSVGGADLLVDLRNRDICWTQASGVDVPAFSASVHEFARSHFGGQVLDQRTTGSESGELPSKVTLIGLIDWEGGVLPVIMIREPLQANLPVITVQVFQGSKTVR